MLLEQLIEGLDDIQIMDDIKEVEISSIAYDSRKVTPGSLFVCIEGYKVDGHKYIREAVNKGAAALVIQKDVVMPEGLPVIKHSNPRMILAEVSARFYNRPSEKLKLIGVTGTKGKTTTTFMIKSILEQAGHKVGLIGTIANYIGDRVVEAQRTTPESLELQEMFADMLSQGVDTVVMEVSSHSLDLYRVHACEFDVGVFTNLTQDHLDFHLNFENYFNAKAKLFDLCKAGKANIDDEYGLRILEMGKCPMKSFGIKHTADIKAKDIDIKPEGTKFKVETSKGEIEVSVPIPGIFSVYNSLSAISACLEFDAGSNDIIKGLENLKVPGRAETVETNGKFTVMVDYAHSPDSLKNILETIKGYAQGRIVVIFGCGGDRDRTKRPIMGRIAGELADFTIISSDNPRTEEPEAIISEIEEGIKGTKGEYIIIPDRQEAIKYAVKNAVEKDIVVIAGKGHETYQVFKDRIVHFDDREIATEAIRQLMANS
ncbi:MAG: UDP-N-acetylmuramoyl-L-alanyl-D-glutamate--2,6-diaminopimelate ligase [Deltaproteobacteria bacterium]